MAIRVQHPMPLPVPSNQAGPSKPSEAGTNFRTLLDQTLNRPQANNQNQNQVLKLSAHAIQRLEQRRIELGPEEIRKMENALVEVERRGGRNAVMFYKDTAFLASVANRTIITAIPLEEDVHVLTQIDSAVAIK